MIKYLLTFLLLLSTTLFAQDISQDLNVTQPQELKKQDDMFILEDTSGMSKKEVREKAIELDKKEEKRVDINDVIESLQKVSKDGTVNLTEVQALWEDLSPKAEKHDWVQTKSGEWFKGKIKTLYRDKLEFDSDEIGIYTFDFEDVKQIKSFQSIAVNIDKVAIFEGILRYKDDKVTIIQGDKKYTFGKEKIVSLAPEGKSEFGKWSGKVTVGLDVRSGNNNQLDYTAKVNVKRITSKDRLTLDYLGRYSEKNNERVTADHRINEKYDRYLTRKFFWTPVVSEFYQDEFKNIQLQTTLGAGIGYIIIDRKDLDWDISSGPAVIRTKYFSVEDGAKTSTTSGALEFSTMLDYDITNKIELLYNYKLTLTNKQAGTYQHHMVTTLENEITDWLDLDITYIWDFIQDPEKVASGETPQSSDHQVLIGFGIEF